MPISLQTGLKQTQKLTMTQSLKQAIELLQLSTIELYEKIASELIENPVIEEESAPGPVSVTSDTSILSRINRKLSGDESISNRGEDRSINFGNTSDSGFANEFDEDRKRNYLESVVAQKETLTEHLLWQARLTARDEQELKVFQNIITSLNEDGFLPQDCNVLMEHCQVSAETMKQTLHTINLFDPVGCAAANVQESLLIQSKYFFPEDTVLAAIIEKHFEDFEKLNYEKIARSLNIHVNNVLEKSKLLQSLDPFPGRQYSSRAIRYIVPDIDVKLVDGELIVSLNDDWIPGIRINTYYIDMARKKSVEKNIRDYIQGKLQSARYLVKNIAHRRNTIIKVVTAIMEHQQKFLVRGPGHLKPLTHLDIADEIGMHESTVSRVTSNKFVQTSWGVYELKYFFVSRLKSRGDEDDKSSDQVMSLIRDIIENEKKEKPCSDGEIVTILAKAGVEVARRTVAKYRNALDIPSSTTRRKLNMIKSEETK